VIIALPEPLLSELAIRRPALHLEVVERLLDMIADGSVSPDERINERVICEKLGISRTPLREALLVLQSEGMVVLNPRRGARVTKLGEAEIREVLELLGGLEAMAGALACANAPPSAIEAIATRHDAMVDDYRRGDMLAYFKNNEWIHAEIVRLSGNREIARIHQTLRRRIVRALYLPNASERRWLVAIEEHQGFVDALRARDAARLGSLLKDHATHTWDELMRPRDSN